MEKKSLSSFIFHQIVILAYLHHLYIMVFVMETCSERETDMQNPPLVMSILAPLGRDCCNKGAWWLNGNFSVKLTFVLSVAQGAAVANGSTRCMTPIAKSYIVQVIATYPTFPYTWIHLTLISIVHVFKFGRHYYNDWRGIWT